MVDMLFSYTLVALEQQWLAIHIIIIGVNDVIPPHSEHDAHCGGKKTNFINFNRMTIVGFLWSCECIAHLLELLIIPTTRNSTAITDRKALIFLWFNKMWKTIFCTKLRNPIQHWCIQKHKGGAIYLIDVDTKVKSKDGMKKNRKKVF